MLHVAEKEYFLSSTQTRPIVACLERVCYKRVRSSKVRGSNLKDYRSRPFCTLHFAICIEFVPLSRQSPTCEDHKKENERLNFQRPKSEDPKPVKLQLFTFYHVCQLWYAILRMQISSKRADQGFWSLILTILRFYRH